MKCYRIYTEDIPENKLRILALVSDHFSGYTVYSATGVWERKDEDSLIVEIIHQTDLVTVRTIAEEIKRINKQDAVLITSHEVTGELV